MNTVYIELNSYLQEVRFFINGKQTDPYSTLSNFTYRQVLRDPAEILDALGNELNDEFVLELTGTDWEYKKLEDAAFDHADCVSCSARVPAIALTTRDRAERLGDRLPEQTFVVLSRGALPQEQTYGNLTLRFTADPSQATCTDLAREKDILGAAQTLLVNSALGEAAKKAARNDSRYGICCSLSPVITAAFPQNIQAGEYARVEVSVFPAGQEIPEVVVRSSNPDVADVDGCFIRALSTGISNIQVFLAGENVPFHSQKIRVEKNVFISRIEVANLDDPLPEGRTVDLDMTIFPPDAVDIGQLEYATSDPGVAEFVNGRLRLNGSGSCDILITGKKARFTKNICVSARLQAYTLSAEQLELRLGQCWPMEVSCVPAVCHNGEFTCSTTDKTVAVVLQEDEQIFIKAIGIGSCIITFRSLDQSVKATCTVTVRSAMYEKKKKKSLFKAISSFLEG